MPTYVFVAHQLVNHRHILVNGGIVGIPSYCCKPQDIINIITARDKENGERIQRKENVSKV